MEKLYFLGDDDGGGNHGDVNDDAHHVIDTARFTGYTCSTTRQVSIHVLEGNFKTTVRCHACSAKLEHSSVCFSAQKRCKSSGL